MIDIPDTSILILTKNAGHRFRSTLAQIFKQRVDSSFEVVIVDSGSTDETLNIIDEYPVRRYSIPPESFNFGLTRDYGFSLTRGKYMVTISQDVVPCNTRWLQSIIKPFSLDSDIVAVQGTTKLPENGDIFFWEDNGFYFTSEVKEWTSIYGVGLSFVNCAIKKEFWNTHQINYTPFSEDKCFQRLIHEAGREITIAKDALVFHGHQYNYKSLKKRILGEGMGWKHAGIEYSLTDCIRDLLENEWMIKKSYLAFRNNEIKSFSELMFPILRPIWIYWGNNVACRSND